MFKWFIRQGLWVSCYSFSFLGVYEITNNARFISNFFLPESRVHNYLSIDYKCLIYFGFTPVRVTCLHNNRQCIFFSGFKLNNVFWFFFFLDVGLPPIILLGFTKTQKMSLFFQHGKFISNFKSIISSIKHRC